MSWDTGVFLYWKYLLWNRTGEVKLHLYHISYNFHKKKELPLLVFNAFKNVADSDEQCNNISFFQAIEGK